VKVMTLSERSINGSEMEVMRDMVLRVVKVFQMVVMVVLLSEFVLDE
jgi:hypothetical protein